MKTKRVVAILLLAVMLLVPASVSVFAADVSIVSGPIKVAYKDSEYFNPQGLVISVDGEEITYTPDNAKFNFVPGLNEHIKVTETEDGVAPTEITVYYDDVKIGTVAVSVQHVWGDCTYLDNNFHGQYCLGCGVVKETLPHNVPEFIPNDDGGLFVQQTQTGTCADCGAKVTENIPGSEGFGSLFDPENLTNFELEIVGYLQNILVTLIQMIVGIK